MKNEKKFYYFLGLFPFFLFAFLVFSSLTEAAIGKVTGMFTLSDSAPEISSIEAYSSAEYKNPKTNFSINTEKIYFRIKVADLNGYKDIEKIEVKIILLNESREQDFRFNYTDANLSSGFGTEAIYVYTYNVLPSDIPSSYRLKAIAFDKENSSSKANFDYWLVKEPTPITGFLVRQEGNGLLTNLFRSFIKWFGFLK